MVTVFMPWTMPQNGPSGEPGEQSDSAGPDDAETRQAAASQHEEKPDLSDYPEYHIG